MLLCSKARKPGGLSRTINQIINYSRNLVRINPEAMWLLSLKVYLSHSPSIWGLWACLTIYQPRRKEHGQCKLRMIWCLSATLLQCTCSVALGRVPDSLHPQTSPPGSSVQQILQQQHRNGLLFFSQEDFPDRGIKLASPASTGIFFGHWSHLRKPFSPMGSNNCLFPTSAQVYR